MNRLIVILFFILYTFISCTKTDQMASTPNNIYIPPVKLAAVKDTTPPRFFLALGDSYTIGQSVLAADRFPVQTAKYLNEQGINFNAPQIIAQTGWTTANLLSSLAYAAPLQSTYDIVTLLIGVNNQYQHRTQKEYADEFLILLNKAIKYAGNNKKRVVVLSIPDYSVTPFATGSDKATITMEIDAFNAINKKIAKQAGVNYVDITGFTRMAATNPLLIATDGLHPSGIEYTVWAKELVPVIKAAIK